MARAKVTYHKPARRLTQAELDTFLEKAADILRGNVDHSEFRGYVFALLFFKRISDVYDEEVAILNATLGDLSLATDPKMHNFVVPNGSAWGDVARKTRTELGTALNEAMIAIERANQPKFDGILTNKVDFNKSDELPREKLINLINHFSTQIFDRAHVSEDVFGDAYEYLIRNFASRAGKSSGEFYTPREVAYAMAEIIEPQPGHSVCDWASGSGGLLLQCRAYVHRHRSPEEADRLRLHAQESNITTYNISRINMILHGVKSWTHEQDDSLRAPQLLDESKKQLLKFDRIVMNPPFSLEDWGYDDFVGGDPYNRFTPAMPPRDNGDYAWLQQVVKSLADDGKAVVVMSQGVLFRGQPAQTEDEDGRNQKADAEYVIREGFIRSNLIECVIVLPPKLFYGNSVPACLIVINKAKRPERDGRILLIWASRDVQKANPQSILRPSDIMRILVPWRAFGDLKQCEQLIHEHSSELIRLEQVDRDRKIQDIDNAFRPLLSEANAVGVELEVLQARDYNAWVEAPDAKDIYFGHLALLVNDKRKLRAASSEAKKAYIARIKELNRALKELEKLAIEREALVAAVQEAFDREVAHLKSAAVDLKRICNDPVEAARYFAIAKLEEISENEFNLNLPRYVDILEPEEEVDLPTAIEALRKASNQARLADEALDKIFADFSGA